MTNRDKGFTLIELMMVVAIIGILASLGVAAYQTYIARAQVSEAIHLMSGQKSLVLEHHGQFGSCPKSGENNIPAAVIIKGKYVASVALGGISPNCTITATMGTTGVMEALRGKSISLSVAGVSSGVENATEWACKSEDIPSRYLPKSCTGT